MAFCSQCGAQLPDGARFCPKCGADAAAESGATQTVEPIVPPAAPVPPHPLPRSHVSQSAISPDGGGAALILPIVVVIAVLIIGFALWTQRDGARPIAETAKQEAAATSQPATTSGESSEQTASTAPSDDRRAVDQASTAVDIVRGNTADIAMPTSAAALDSAFYRDPRGAAQRYAGPVRVSGVIATMVTPGRTPALSLEGRSRFNYMIVNFPIGYRERLAPLSKGMFITVTCGSTQSLGGTTILDGCALE